MNEINELSNSFFKWDDTQVLGEESPLSSSHDVTVTLGLGMPATLCGFFWTSQQQNHMLKEIVNRVTYKTGERSCTLSESLLKMQPN